MSEFDMPLTSYREELDRLRAEVAMTSELVATAKEFNLMHGLYGIADRRTMAAQERLMSAVRKMPPLTAVEGLLPAPSSPAPNRRTDDMTITGYLGSLEQENQRLQAENDFHSDCRRDMRAEIDRLRSELDKGLESDAVGNLIHDHVVAACRGKEKEFRSEIDRLRADNERLRDALEYIADHDPDKRGLHGEMIDVLRSAVAGAKAALVFPDPLYRPDPPKEAPCQPQD